MEKLSSIVLIGSGTSSTYGVIRSSFSPDKVGIIGAAARAIERYGR